MGTYSDILDAYEAGMTFGFKTKDERDRFVADIKREQPDLPFCVNLDPDLTSEKPWLVNYPNVGPDFQSGRRLIVH
tara:strand:+ start:6000 stop:6227 length:228 start_codon:yes stop_codon:yes gene_type:complete